MSLAITDLSACGHGQAGEVSAHVGPDLRGVLLDLVEVYQRQERWEDAIACLERLRRLEPDDVVVKLSLADLLVDAHPGDKTVRRKVVRLASGLENETPVHTALLLYKARALRGLGLLIAAREILTAPCAGRRGGPRSFLRRSGMNEPWSMMTSASASSHAVNSKSFTLKTRTMRTWQEGWDYEQHYSSIHRKCY